MHTAWVGGSVTAEGLQRLRGLSPPCECGDGLSSAQDIGELNRSLEEPLSLGITTNGVRLAKYLPALRAAGVTNINLSCSAGAVRKVATSFASKWCHAPAVRHARHAQKSSVASSVSRLVASCLMSSSSSPRI